MLWREMWAKIKANQNSGRQTKIKKKRKGAEVELQRQWGNHCWWMWMGAHLFLLIICSPFLIFSFHFADILKCIFTRKSYRLSFKMIKLRDRTFPTREQVNLNQTETNITFEYILLNDISGFGFYWKRTWTYINIPKNSKKSKTQQISYQIPPLSICNMKN